MSVQTAIPRSFVSHASEDKAQFARPLAESLRAKGVDAWLDEWEMGPGDSLIQKIFSEGIQGTDAVVVVLSETSIQKPWVQKELSVAAVKNIENATKLIPVRIDLCQVPEVLLDVYRIDWHKEGSAESVAQRISDQLFGVTKKPHLGTPPPHLSSPKFTIPGLHPQDIKVLEIIFNASLVNSGTLIQADTIMPLAEQEGITFDQIKESIEVLERHGFLTDEDQSIAGRFIIVRFHPGQHLKLAESLGQPVESALRRTVALVINGQANSLFAIAEQIPEIPASILESILQVLEGNGFWKSVGTCDGNLHLHSDTVTARRWLEANS